MTLAELVAQLAAADGTPEEKAKALRNTANTVFQHVFDTGHSQATAKLKSELEAKDAALEAEKKATAQAEARLETLKEQQPEAAKLREQYDAEIADLKETHKAEKADMQSKFDGAQIDRALSELRSEMVALGLDPDYAQVQTEKSEVRDRFKAVDGRVQVTQAGKDIPITAPDGSTATRVLATALYDAADPKWQSSNGDSGTGRSTNDRRGSGKKGSFYDGIREDAKKAHADAPTRTASESTLRERLGMSSNS